MAPLVIVHRLPATDGDVATALEAGANGFELDVQLAGEGVVVSHYLPILQVPGWLQHDGAHVRWRDGSRSDPTLPDALDRLPPDVLVLLDPKEKRRHRRHSLADSVSRAASDFGVDRSRFVVSTRFAEDLARYRAAGLRTWRTIGSPRGLAHTLAAGPIPEDGVSIRHTLLTPDSLSRLRRVTGTIVAWTVRTPDRAGELRRAGVDGITADRPAVMRAASAVDPLT